MEGRITEYTKRNNRVVVTLELNPCELQQFEGKLLDVDLKVHRNKRSISANAYAWTLMQQIAEAIGSDKWTVYLDMLSKYSSRFELVTVASEEVAESLEKMVREVINLGKDKQGRIVLQLFEGSSGFDSKEYSVFLDGICQECKELNIPTMTRKEIAMLEGIRNE